MSLPNSDRSLPECGGSGYICGLILVGRGPVCTAMVFVGRNDQEAIRYYTAGAGLAPRCDRLVFAFAPFVWALLLGVTVTSRLRLGGHLVAVCWSSMFVLPLSGGRYTTGAAYAQGGEGGGDGFHGADQPLGAGFACDRSSLLFGFQGNVFP